MTNQEQTQNTDHTPAPENEDKPALAEEQPDTSDAEHETQDTHEDLKSDERAQKAAAEAKRYRLQLRETQAELEATRATVSELEETLITYLGKEAYIDKPEILVKLGFDRSSLRDETGSLLPQAEIIKKIDQFGNDMGLAFGRRPMPPDPSQWAEPADGDTWEDSFKMH